jgi:hypothetical protein
LLALTGQVEIPDSGIDRAASTVINCFCKRASALDQRL